ncbi:MAG: replication-associated recombination protein A [Brevibacterium sp.]|uniref:replication-associated recombination protein A n=1 Tax=Brevibacterium sp. TaxID=1701 RepID=UPI00264757B8|nr:replication-associated recombination protein A [Brevibacterium sp.]MDN5806970.1 replication-associated recombination protein A [Brevibacterium sp.]MDN5832450.1 replication-associated recombination protein A [Brevibacterium sp.]MDN5875065.1 replication-associated recombination protein A [Brevibacterium sp.]MDN5908818.1 replication-associated recombination protein A [Brevibacterium sp.]MDN6157060.1 replication-associated recombination protein A [Brevibacterium sp.]
MPGPGVGGSSADSGRALDPLAVRMRPRTIAEVVGQDHLTFPGSPLVQLVEASGGDRAGASSVILWGPPGVGKTTLAHVISHAPGRTFVELSAITAGVKDVRQVIENARREREMYQRTTVLFLDEIHRFSKAQQDALLPAVENRLVVLVAATTENPSFSIISPLLSRSLLLTLRPLDDAAIADLLDRAVASERGLAGQFELEPAAKDFVVRIAGADARRSLTILEAAAGIAAAQMEFAESASEAADPEASSEDSGEESAEAADDSDSQARPIIISEAACAEASSETVLRYDRNGDQHYDVVSAFIKSIRGSDVDAALHYLARMIVAGEDPRFIARRVVISAAEDIGMADPQALPIAVAASTAVQNIGMPEGRIPLAEAVTYLAMAPKSNASYRALDAAIADVKNGFSGQVPTHLRDAHYPGAKELGHGEGYKYSHDHPHGVAAQEYLPETLRGKRYYEPTGNGMERSLGERLEMLQRLLRP